MKIRKIMTAITATAMAGVMFAGCSSSNGGSSAGSSADSSSAADNGGAENNGTGSGEVSLTVWGSQEDQEMLKQMCDAFAAANPDKKYTFTYGVVSEADAQKEVLKDISAAADSHSFPIRLRSWLMQERSTESPRIRIR